MHKVSVLDFRQNFILYQMLISSSLCSPEWPLIHRIPFCGLLSTYIIVMNHQAWLLVLYSFKTFIFYLCVGTCVSTCMPHVSRFLWRAEKHVRFPGGLVTGDCELLEMSARNKMWSSEREVNVLNCWAIAPAQWHSSFDNYNSVREHWRSILTPWDMVL